MCISVVTQCHRSNWKTTSNKSEGCSRRLNQCSCRLNVKRRKGERVLLEEKGKTESLRIKMAEQRDELVKVQDNRDGELLGQL